MKQIIIFTIAILVPVFAQASFEPHALTILEIADVSAMLPQGTTQGLTNAGALCNVMYSSSDNQQIYLIVTPIANQPEGPNYVALGAGDAVLGGKSVDGNLIQYNQLGMNFRTFFQIRKNENSSTSVFTKLDRGTEGVVKGSCTIAKP